MRNRAQKFKWLVAFGVLGTIAVLVTLRMTGLWRPPRPMFANEFGVHVERPSVPTWRYCEPLVDQHGVWIWADFADNVLAVHVTGIQDTSRIGPIVPGVQETKFRLGLYPVDRWATLQRTQNELVMLSQSGRFLRFPLPHGAAESFYRTQSADPTLWKASTALLPRVESLLTAEQNVEAARLLAAPTTVKENQ